MLSAISLDHSLQQRIAYPTAVAEDFLLGTAFPVGSAKINVYLGEYLLALDQQLQLSWLKPSRHAWSHPP